jgi:hypothetical protein
MNEPNLVESRARWLAHIASLVETPRAETSFGGGFDRPLNDIERALVEVHVGFTHLMGGDRNEASLPRYCTAEEADSIVSRWRAGAQSPHIVGEVDIVWHCLWQVGFWSSCVREELSDLIASSFLSSHFGTTPPEGDPLVAHWGSIENTQGNVNFSFGDVWNCAESHLEKIRFADDISQNLIESLCALEQRALVGEREQPYLEESFSQAVSVIDAFMAVPGSWGGPDPSDVPPWLRDFAIVRGGRIRQERAGVVPCWFVVAESTEELRAISAWSSGSQNVALVQKQESSNTLFLRLEVNFDDGQGPGVVEFIYETSHIRAATSLDMLAWVGIIRLEVYELDHGELKFAFATGVRIGDLRDELVRPDLRAFPAFDWLADLVPSADDILFRMRNTERAQFELVRRGETLRRDASNPAAAAYRSYLTRVHDGAQSEYAGVPADAAGIDRVHRELLTALSVLSNPVDEIALQRLGPDRGFAQIQFIQDEPMRTVCAVASQNADGSQDAHLVTLAVQDYEAGGLQADEDGLAELAALGLKSIVLSPSGPLYPLALHEDFLDDGFEQVSYVHRSGILGTRSPSSDCGQSVLIAGWAGERGETNHLKYLDIELSALESIYRKAKSEVLDLGSLPRVVHLAGHGEAGVSATEHWLKASESEILTPARVLLDVDASNTDLVYLSACSTGRGVFGLRRVMNAIPLDVAFLERGAACVVSTSAPVNDVVASAFAIVFHSTWRAGASVWDAYTEARALLSRGVRSPEASDVLEASWPTWEADLTSAVAVHPDDWMKFRLSGRHW